MSEHDDTLLDEDLGDEEYDLGNDEEEALLADDYEIDRQNSYKGEEETDDVLDLGVTDALDDLDAEDENIEFSRSKTDNSDADYYKDGERSEIRSKYYEQEENTEYKNEQGSRQYEERGASEHENAFGNLGKGDLREKLQKNLQKSQIYVGNGQGLEDDDGEEAKERRNRFQNERTIVSPKMNSNIPDTLENVVTSETSRSFRGRGRGRISRPPLRGRFNTQNIGNFNPRFSAIRSQQPFENQPSVCRPPLLDTRPSFFIGLGNAVQNQQMLCQQGNPQVQPFQHYPPNGPIQGPPHFVDNRSQFGPGQLQGQMGPRQLHGPRPDYAPRRTLPPSSMQPHMQNQGPPPGPNQVHGQGPPYGVNSCPPVSNQSSYGHGPPGPLIHRDNPQRFVPNNSGPPLQGNAPTSILGGPPNSLPNAGPGGPVLQGNPNLPLPPGFSRQQPHSSQGLNHPNIQMPLKPPYDNRPPFQESQFENRPPYDRRPSYPDQVGMNNQFNNNSPASQSQHPPANVPNVPLPPGHKILINPHFRGAVQPASDARLVWDSAQQSQSSASAPPFSQSVSSYQGPASYGHSQQAPPPSYQQNYQQNKTDDPYMYFSDVWQENKPQKPAAISLPSKSYTDRSSSYSRESNYSSNSKYKSENQWDQKDHYQDEYRESHANYRERDLPSKSRDDLIGKSRPLPVHRDDPYDQSYSSKSLSNRPVTAMRVSSRMPQKRPSDSSDRSQRDASPKRTKPTNRNLHEVRTVDTLSNVVSEKKEGDSDPEMQEYRKKMEEQKRLREKILREKENRRKLAALEKSKQNEEGKIETATEAVQESKSTAGLMGAVKETVSKSQPNIGRNRARPVNIQATEVTDKSSGVRIVRTIQSVQSTNDSESIKKEAAGSNAENSGQAIPSQNSTRRVVLQKPLATSQKIATTIQKTVSNLQKSQLQQKTLTASPGQLGGVKKLGSLAQKTASSGPQRIVTQKLTPSDLAKTVINVQDIAGTNAQRMTVHAQNNQRIVVQKKLPEIRTNTVKLENLAASTSEGKIRSMCQGIGTIESIQMGERSATIVFKTQSAAMVFHKKYQRKMLDLSLITVRLIPPQASETKATTNIVKVS